MAPGQVPGLLFAFQLGVEVQHRWLLLSASTLIDPAPSDRFAKNPRSFSAAAAAPAPG